MCINKEIIKDSSKRHWERWPLIPRQRKWKVCRRTSEIQELISEESVKASSSNYAKHGNRTRQAGVSAFLCTLSTPLLVSLEGTSWSAAKASAPKERENTLRAFHRNFLGSFSIKYIWWMQEMIYIHLNGLWDWEMVQHQHPDFSTYDTRTLLWNDISHSL